uniref:Uncharacterized protein n=1 Tax=Leptocylindrus danicus TaxID=163516 RepID=A0A7S2LN43_9STRA
MLQAQASPTSTPKVCFSICIKTPMSFKGNSKAVMFSLRCIKKDLIASSSSSFKKYPWSNPDISGVSYLRALRTSSSSPASLLTIVTPTGSFFPSSYIEAILRLNPTCKPFDFRAYSSLPALLALLIAILH